MKLKLAQYREKTPYTQSDLAEKLGVSPKTEWNWEQGKSFPNAEQLWKLAVILECTPDDLLGWYDHHPRTNAPGLTADEADVIGDYRECTPEWKKTLAMNARAAKGESKKGTRF